MISNILEKDFTRDIEDFMLGDKKPEKILKLEDYFPDLVDMYPSIYDPMIGNIRSIFERLMMIISEVKDIKILDNFTRDLCDLYTTVEAIQCQKNVYNNIMKTLRKKYHFQPRKIHILAYYNLLRFNKDIKKLPILEKHLIVKNMRSLSGIISVSVIVDPYPKFKDKETGEIVKQRFTCKHDCHFCPTQVDSKGKQVMPKSYLLREPACARGFKCKFSAVEQIYTRLFSYMVTGHPTTKIELIVLGGTWSEINQTYQETFIRDLYYACNTFPYGTYRYPRDLQTEIEFNETAECRVIGLTLETRPDSLIGKDGDDEIKRLRSYGCTRLQLGVQSTYNHILKKINRGHTIEDSIAGIKKWKNAGGKLIAHFMPDLPDSSPKLDMVMWEYLIYTQDLQPDEIKVYPCQTTPFTKIEKWYREGSYTPYATKDLNLLIDVIIHLRRISVKAPWIRFTRIIRDIPNDYILAGNPVTNLRQVVEARSKELGVKCWCTRCREVKGRKIKNPYLKIHKYRGSEGTEYFLEYVNKDDMYTLYGFLRLRIPDNNNEIIFNSLKNKGMVRELHVYGKVLNIKTQNNSASQHSGLGKKLLQKAEEICKQHNKNGISIISGIGVREYYLKRGYKLNEDGGYMIKHFDILSNTFIWCSLVILFSLMYLCCYIA